MALYHTASSFNTIINALADLYTIITLLSSNVSQSQNRCIVKLLLLWAKYHEYCGVMSYSVTPTLKKRKHQFCYILSK